MATSLLTALPTEKLLERLAEVQVADELKGRRNAPFTSALCTEIKNRLPEVSAGLAEFLWPDEEPSASYAETLLIFAGRALEARASYLAAA